MLFHFVLDIIRNLQTICHLKKWTTSCKMNPTFSEIDFYDYKIRMGVVDTTPMYLVSDLLRQYNEKHGTNKRFKKYIEIKQAQEVIEYMAKSVGPNSGLRSEEGQNEQNLDCWNSYQLKIGAISAEDGKWYIPHVIQFVTTPNFNGTNKRFANYLQNKQAQEVIEYMAKSIGENSPL